MSHEFVLFYPANLPNGSAGATRIVSFARIMKRIGYHPVMLGIGAVGVPAKRDISNGIEYELLSFPELSLQGIHAIKRETVTKKYIQCWLDDYRKAHGIDGILFSEYQGYASFLCAYARKYKIPLFFDAVEWYPRESFTGRFGLFRYARHSWDMRYGYRRIGNIICISQYLYEHFKRQGCNCIRIPTIVDVANFKFSSEANAEKLILAYAGVPWGKDDIQTVMQAIAMLSLEEQSKIELRLYGVTYDEVRTNFGVDRSICMLLGKQVYCFGRIPHEYVREELSRADFTVLLREDTRKNKAGFPTKVGESMAAGVPVIANLTSDIGLYLHDGKEGIVCIDCSVGACLEALRRCLKFTIETKQKMRIIAQKQARLSFDFRSYSDEMQSYIENGIVM